MANRSAFCVLSLLTVIGFAGIGGAQQPPAAPPEHFNIDSLPAILIGHVTDSAGVGLRGAEISLVDSDRLHAITDDSGAFHITGLRPGTTVFNVRRIGYQAATFTAVLRPGKTHRAVFALSVTAQELPLVAVTDTVIKSHWLDLFERRRATSRGTFLTRDAIKKQGARIGSELLRSVPGVRLTPLRAGGTNQIIMTRGAGARTCFPAMFVHNIPYSGTLDDFIADDIEALEIYVGVSEIPAELDKNGKGICGAIVIWTRDPRKPP